MAPITSAKALALLALSSTLVHGADFSHALRKKNVSSASAATNNALHRRQSGVVPERDITEYQLWFGNFTVGSGKPLELIIDTGSADIILDPGRYVPSANMSRFGGQQKFSISYEGVDATGGGFETINGTVIVDTVSGSNLTVPQQAFGNATSYSVQDTAPKPEALMQDGIIGFLDSEISSFRGLDNTPWFYSLCNQHLISECRFGCAFGTEDTGVQVFGEVDESLIKDGEELTTAPFHRETFPLYTTTGDVSVEPGDTSFENQMLIFDSGTQNIQAPVAQFEEIWNSRGWKYTTYNDSETGSLYLIGYFPCDSPPTLSIKLPSQYDLTHRPAGATYSENATSYDLLSPFASANNGNNNCTAVVSGTNSLTDPRSNTSAWLIGQPYFQGYYIDFNADAQELGIANLKDSAGSGTY